MSDEKAHWLENTLLTRYAHKRVRGEWFDLSPREVNEVVSTLGGRKRALYGGLPPSFIKGLMVVVAFLTVAMIYATMIK